MMEVGPVDGEEASIRPTLAEPSCFPSQWGPPEHDGEAVSCQCLLPVQGQSSSVKERTEVERLCSHFCTSISQMRIFKLLAFKFSQLNDDLKEMMAYSQCQAGYNFLLHISNAS